MKKQIILASSSPRRREILQQVQIPFSVRVKPIDETMVTTNIPQERVKQLADLKANAVSLMHDHEVILAADTLVAMDGEIFEKPVDDQQAYEMLSQLSGKSHDVFTGVMLRTPEKKKCFVERTKVEFWPLTKQQIEWYLNTKEPFDKAGAYGIQEIGALFVKKISGDFFNVVGLPISRVVQELDTLGVTLY